MCIYYYFLWFCGLIGPSQEILIQNSHMVLVRNHGLVVESFEGIEGLSVQKTSLLTHLALKQEWLQQLKTD